MKLARTFNDVCGLQPSSEESCIFANSFGVSGLSAYVEWMETSTPKTLFKGTNPALKKPSNIPEIYAKMFGRFH